MPQSTAPAEIELIERGELPKKDAVITINLEQSQMYPDLSDSEGLPKFKWCIINSSLFV